MGLYNTMKFLDYLKEKSWLIFIYLTALIFIVLILFVFKVYYTGIIMIVFVLVLLGLLLFLYRFFQKKRFYDEVYSILENIDDKTLIHEAIKEPSFLEGQILMNVLRDTNKYKIEQINNYKYLLEEFQEFMELWAHEIKTPLAAINLIGENNKNKVTESILEETLKIEGFIEQILFYARSEMPEKDYLIKNTKLEDIVNKVIIRNKNIFLNKNIRLEMHNLDCFVKTDSKWMEFIINQIINNSIKYFDKSPKLSIVAKKDKEKISLIIEDNGIGINKQDLPRVFEKGFTGSNGRGKYNSTGMGLYLVKKLCDSLGNSVSLESQSGKGTIVKIVFPLGSFTSEIER